MNEIKLGDIVRYRDGVSSLFQVQSIIKSNGTNIYYGKHCMSGMVNSKDVSIATEEEEKDYYFYKTYTEELNV